MFEENGNEMTIHQHVNTAANQGNFNQSILIEESLSLQDKEIDMIKKHLQNIKEKENTQQKN